MKWMDVVMGEVQAKRDDEEAREARRREVAQATQACLDRVVRPEAQALATRLKTAGIASKLCDCEGDGHLGRRLRLTAGETATEAFLEFSAEPFHRLIVVWLQRSGEAHPHRFAVLRLDDLDSARVQECARAFERGLVVEGGPT